MSIKFVVSIKSCCVFLIDSFGVQRMQTALADERWLIDSLELACKGDYQLTCKGDYQLGRVSTKFGDFSLFIGRRGHLFVFYHPGEMCWHLLETRLMKAVYMESDLVSSLV